MLVTRNNKKVVDHVEARPIPPAPEQLIVGTVGSVVQYWLYTLFGVDSPSTAWDTTIGHGGDGFIAERWCVQTCEYSTDPRAGTLLSVLYSLYRRDSTNLGISVSSNRSITEFRSSPLDDMDTLPGDGMQGVANSLQVTVFGA